LYFQNELYIEIYISLLSKAVTVSVSSKSDFSTLPDKTWYKRICVKDCTSTMSIESPSRYSSKAALVGANTVKSPSPDKVSARFARVSASTRIEKSSSDLATSTILPAGFRTRSIT